MARNNMFGGNMANMQQMIMRAQAQMERVQAEIFAKEFTFTAGGGVVTAVVTGKKELLRVDIAPDVVDPDDVEMLSDLIVAAVNGAMTAAEEELNREMQKVTAGLPIGR